MAAQSQQIHPEILKHNIKVGDFIIISPDKEKGHEKIFLVSLVGDNEVFIHPGARPSQMRVLSPGGIRGEWILTNNTEGEKFTDWTYNPRDEFDIPTRTVEEIKIIWEENDNRAIKLVKPDNDDAMDYRRIKELIMEDVNVMEREEKRHMKRYKVAGEKRNGVNYHGYEEDIRIEARTFVGAMIAYMNWLDTQNIQDNDNEMWDQVDQFFFNPNNYNSIEDLVIEFEEDFDALEQIHYEPIVISYPGPQTNLIKPARG